MLRIEKIETSLGSFRLHSIDIEIKNGEYMVILGPTGTGKTVLLETIAGIHTPDSGHIWLDNKEITRLPPEKRHIGMVYQDHTLFPHLSVFDNIAFGLKCRRMEKAAIRKKTLQMASLLDISHILHRYPRHLSGGEKQRVALARALAIDPQVLLLDEPLNALDRNTKERIKKELKRLHENLGITILHITHDISEAFFLADRLSVMKDGRLLQTGRPQDILKAPYDRTVAELLGIRNFLTVDIKNGVVTTSIGRISTCILPMLYKYKEPILAIPDWAITFHMNTTINEKKNLWQGELTIRSMTTTDTGIELELKHENGQCLYTTLSHRELHSMKEELVPGKNVKVAIKSEHLSILHRRSGHKP